MTDEQILALWPKVRAIEVSEYYDERGITTRIDIEKFGDKWIVMAQQDVEKYYMADPKGHLDDFVCSPYDSTRFDTQQEAWDVAMAYFEEHKGDYQPDWEA